MHYDVLRSAVRDLWDYFETLQELETYINKVYGFKRLLIKHEIYKLAKEKTK
ncbi:hypothetical protein vBBak6_062 [Bacillus phage v_B-Bak6]|uniref:Uncharacterized protein n=1 Tax=Bacillus phage Basilisk TaxID=1296654 RepID=S5MLV2_9CAUD|nr:hypothetical protein PP653_gp096 [Bacillus phage Basilisk]AGR46615.1 hypothetical protein BASILISK_71 [Bacillus phage Basilisk]AXY83022.1 hypothetical protein vBBak1_062 [Bacillus phage v_B-Bak1]AXY83142.1 hypothetical protein vBBak6_062 [Bacillus phage v_B-Bak6]